MREDTDMDGIDQSSAVGADCESRQEEGVVVGVEETGQVSCCKLNRLPEMGLVEEAGTAHDDSDDNIKVEIVANKGMDRNYESEPATTKKFESRKKLRKRANWNSSNQRGSFVRPSAVSKEMRLLSRKHAILEKNLKIDGLPDMQPKPRKRRLSLSSSIGRSHDKDVVSYKRKRLTSVDTRPKKDHMPKWELMGGDANDPLNLNGLAHSEEGRLLNLKTPESSPLPMPDFRKIVYVKVPPNIEDPLNLEGKHDQRVIDRMLNSTVKKRHRSKKKKFDDNNLGTTDAVATSSSTQLSTTNATEVVATETLNTEPETHVISEQLGDNVESKPVCAVTTPTKSVTLTGRRSRSISISPDRKFRRQISGGRGKFGANEPTKFPDKPKFTMGNYNRYYGYRNKDHVPDPRLQYFDLSWFKDKDVLDIGCNVGHMTLAVAENFHPHKILGMDIDAKLIQSARQNIRHMLSMRRKDSVRCPRVFEMTRGPLEAHPLMGLSDNFPNNVLFLQGNYVPGSEEVLNLQKEEFDIILALSITKWIHLNNGDSGLKLFFQKIYRQLRPGGRLILEPQPWSTYRKRAKLSPELFAQYQSIKLKPEGFKHYLLSIGFVKCEVIGVPVTKSKGFRRPLILFTKGDNRQTPNVTALESLDVCQECGNTDKSQCYHPQYTGMRQGPYASRLYDHINHPYMSGDSPCISSSRTYSNHSIVHGVDDSTSAMMEADVPQSQVGILRRLDASGDFHNSTEGWGSSGIMNSSSSSNASSGSRTHGSSTSSSYESQSDSVNSRSLGSSNVNGSSSVWSNGSYFSTESNVDFARELYVPNNLGPNGDIEFDHENINGQSGQSSHNISPEYGEPNGQSHVNVVSLLMSDNVVSPLIMGVNAISPPLDVSVISSPSHVNEISSLMNIQLSSPRMNIQAGSPLMNIQAGSPQNGASSSNISSDLIQSPPSVLHQEDITVQNSSPSESSEHVNHDVDFDDDAVTGDVSASALVAEEDDQRVEPIHSNNSMNGDHTLVVVQQWENDSQNANLDASLPPHT